jgi:hypothetical protein
VIGDDRIVARDLGANNPRIASTISTTATNRKMNVASMRRFIGRAEQRLRQLVMPAAVEAAVMAAAVETTVMPTDIVMAVMRAYVVMTVMMMR